MSEDHLARNHQRASMEEVVSLVAELGLSPAEEVLLQDEMSRSGSSILEAAAALGFMSVAGSRGQGDQAAATGPVEAAIRKVSARQRLVLKPRGGPVEPQGEATPGKWLMLVHEPYGVRSEQIRALRTELMLRFSASAFATTLAVVSADKKDGRSLFAADMAIAFAQLGKPTLLVDADLRGPSQHELFGCSNERGLTTLLTGDTEPFVHSVRDIPSLHLLTAGPVSSNPLEILSAKRLEGLVDIWRQQYAYIVFDTPAVADYSDALNVVTVASRALLVARAHHTDMKAAREMMRKLAVTQAEIMGSVLNHF